MNRHPWISRLFWLASVLVLGLSACNPQATEVPTVAPTAAAEKTEIWLVVTEPEGSNAQQFQAQMAQEYESAHPNIKVKFEWAGYELYDQKIRGYIESGNPPDAFGSAISVLIQYAKEGMVAPLDQYLDQQNYEGDAAWKDSFYASLMAQDYVADAKNGAGYYAIPTQMHAAGIFYNAKLFADNGLEPPTTIQELVAQCETFKESGLSCFGIDGGFTPYLTIPFAYIASRVGGAQAYYDTALHKEGTSWADNPDWLTAAQIMQQLYDHTQPGFVGSAWPAAQVEFSQGKMAMMWVPTWLPSELKGTAPDDFQMGLFRWPPYEGGKGDQTVTQLNFNGYVMPVGARHPQEVMDFLKYLTSRHATEVQAEQLLIPSPTVGAQLPEELAGVADMLADSQTMPEGMGVDNDAPEWRTVVLEPLLADLALGAAPEEFIANLQQQSDEYYANR